MKTVVQSGIASLAVHCSLDHKCYVAVAPADILLAVTQTQLVRQESVAEVQHKYIPKDPAILVQN